ncbi:MAG TPA: tRNA methyl transferase PRC-barrel domain-containing protein, partial [Bacteroidales bacterium]|nr:tRNA methyl transferase PRC-barrel domain-containing protein [Bacteroidales bacterium]
QGICFVGKVDLPAFLQQKLKPKRGEIIEIPAEAPVYQPVVVGETEEELNEQTSPYYYLPEMGEVAGSHMGAHFYTIGQRKGLNVGGKPEPLFVIATDIDRNVIYTGQGKMHPGLFRNGLFVRKEELHWVRPDLEMVPGEERDYQVRIRYRQPLQQARLFCREEGMYIIFEDPQRGIAAGQFAAWYDDGEVIGSGVINA